MLDTTNDSESEAQNEDGKDPKLSTLKKRPSFDGKKKGKGNFFHHALTKLKQGGFPTSVFVSLLVPSPDKSEKLVGGRVSGHNMIDAKLNERCIKLLLEHSLKIEFIEEDVRLSKFMKFFPYTIYS